MCIRRLFLGDRLRAFSRFDTCTCPARTRPAPRTLALRCPLALCVRSPFALTLYNPVYNLRYTLTKAGVRAVSYNS